MPLSPARLVYHVPNGRWLQYATRSALAVLCYVAPQYSNWTLWREGLPHRYSWRMVYKEPEISDCPPAPRFVMADTQLKIAPIGEGLSLKARAYDALKTAILNMNIYANEAELRLDERDL